MLKYLQFIVCFLTIYSSFTQPIFAQKDSKGIMKGVISTKDGKPARFINIRINDTKLGDISNEKGEYTITNVPAGHWFVRVSAIGISTQELEVTVSEKEVLIQNFQIKETSEQLETVTVNGRRNTMADKESDYISRMPLKNIENPQSYSIATKELLKEKNIIDYQSAVRSIPGVAISTTDYQGSSVAWTCVRRHLAVELF